MRPAGPIRRRIDHILNFAIDDSLSEDDRRVRRTLMAAYLGVSVLTPLWGVVYIPYGEVRAGLIPTIYGVFTWGCLFALPRVGGWEWLRVSQLVMHLFLPFFLMWELGGFAPSSAVLIWSLLAPLSSMWADRRTEALVVTGGFVALTAVTALIEGQLADTNQLPANVITIFWVGNFATMTSVILILVAYFAGQHLAALEALRRNRELESAYLQQELTLRQNEKLATIGKLSAGLAHELNNPAAAVQQATGELTDMLLGAERIRTETALLGLTDGEDDIVAEFTQRIVDRTQRREYLDPLERSDREAETEDFLDRLGIDDAWLLAPPLVGLGVDRADLQRLREAIRPDCLPVVLRFLAGQFDRQTLLGSLDESTTRIVGMVRALKTYTHLDRSAREGIDIHDGLDSTLIMFESRLKDGVDVHRQYADDLPGIQAFAGELNQVWTNLLDNALDAMNGSGEISITTRRDGDHVVVEWCDNGPGIPADIIDTVFDPFVTSKAPGEGTGLGLNITHNIVTQNHGGTIAVSSEPGRTVFTIRLPVHAADDST